MACRSVNFFYLLWLTIKVSQKHCYTCFEIRLCNIVASRAQYYRNLGAPHRDKGAPSYPISSFN